MGVNTREDVPTRCTNQGLILSGVCHQTRWAEEEGVCLEGGGYFGEKSTSTMW